MKRVLLVLLIALVLAPLAAASTSTQVDVSGPYGSNWDDVHLQQRGRHVTGSYVCCGGGTIDGTIEGRTVRYRWRQPGGEGRGIWTLGDGSLEGTWGVGNDEDDGGRWDLTRDTGGDATLAE
ncbi:MAG: hypothetical protein JWP01_1129 [Myxococcales bacterium]|nr:hypothetical protein [Myxococcales bacterium]